MALSKTTHQPNQPSNVTLLAVEKLDRALQAAVEQKQAVLLLVSGGSALKLLDHLNLDPIILLASKLTIGVLDERYSSDPTINNFAQLIQTKLFAATIDTGAIFIDTRLEAGETASGLANRFEATLKAWTKAHPHGRIIITQGMGPDGHTAGIMPFPENPALFEELFNHSNKWVVTYDAGSKNPYPMRITTTCSFLRQVSLSIFYVTGVEKQAALSQVYSASGTLAETPARIVKEMKHVELCSDLQIKKS